MNLGKLLSSIFIIALIAVSAISILASPVHALPTVNLASMPSCGSSVSQSVYDSANNVVWQVCYLNGVLWKQDFTTNPATLTSYATNTLMGSANPLGLTQDSSDLYAIGRVSREVFKIPKADPTSISILLASGTLTGDVLYPTILSGFLYVPYGNGVAKIDTSSGVTTLIATGVQMTACDNDGVSLVYCTASNSGQLYEINPSTNIGTLRVSGLSTPIGLEVTSSVVYIAQDIAGGSVVRVSRATWTTTATGTVSSGTNDKPYGVALIGAYLVATTEGLGGTVGTKNVYVFDPTTMASLAVIQSPVVTGGNARPLFMLSSDGAKIFAAFQGSSGSVEISNWQASVPTSTTTTTTTSTVTTISVTTGTSTTSTQTSQATNECGGPAGAKCKWTPIVIPTIHVSSIYRLGLCDINGTCRDADTVIVSGFEFFMAGPSSGDFVQMASLVGCCAAIMSNLNPSDGTFAAMSISATPYTKNWYDPTPPSKNIGPLAPTSETKFGWFCNNDHITQYVWQCDGSATPVSYRTFSFTAPVNSVLRIEATGTASQGQVSYWNLFT